MDHYLKSAVLRQRAKNWIEAGIDLSELPIYYMDSAAVGGPKWMPLDPEWLLDLPRYWEFYEQAWIGIPASENFTPFKDYIMVAQEYILEYEGIPFEVTKTEKWHSPFKLSLVMDDENDSVRA